MTIQGSARNKRTIAEHVRPAGWGVLALICVAAGLMLVLATGRSMAGLAGVVVASVVLAALGVRSRTHISAVRSASGLAQDVPARLLGVLTVGAWTAASVSGPEAALVWAWVGLAVLAVAVEPLLRALGALRPLVVANVEGTELPRAGLLPGVWLAVAWVSSALLIVAAAVSGASVPIVPTVLAGGAVLAHVALAAVTGQRLRALLRQRTTVVDALTRRNATLVIVHTGGSSGARYQIPMWAPHVRATGLPFIVVVKDPTTVPTIAQLTDAPVVSADERDGEFLETVMTRGPKVAIFLRNSKLNRPYLAFDQLKRVFLNHGDSDKPANFNPMHREFDRVFVCGEQGIERYRDNGVAIPRERFVVVGRPQIADIVRVQQHISTVASPVVMYAPTWRGKHTYDRYTSLPVGVEIVSALLARGATVIFRPHPVSRAIPEDRQHIKAIEKLLRADRDATGREHEVGRRPEKEWSVADCTNRADAMVSDVSSVTSDFLQSGKPYALIAMTCTPEEFARRVSVARGGYVVSRDLSNLDAALDDLLVADPLGEQRDHVRQHTLGDFDGIEAQQAFVEAIRGLAGAVTPPGYADSAPGE